MKLKEVYDIRAFGAVGDGVTINTFNIQQAINECHEKGGGTVLISGGIFVSGTLYLKSNVYLEVSVSGKLLASPHIEDYGEDTHHNRYVNEKDMDRCFIYAEDVRNTGVIGQGEIDGNAECFPNQNSIYRPMMMRFLRCEHIVLRGMRLYNAAAWTTAFLDSRDIWIDALDICNEKRYNGDGLDFDGCQDVFIVNCKIKGTDDNLCLQSSSKAYPVKNIHITNCHFTSICAGIRIGLKSVGDISQVAISNITFENIWREGIKIECTEGGAISDVVIKGIVMRNVRRPIFVLLNNRLDRIGSSIGLDEMPEIGRMENIQISDVIATDDEEMKNIHYRFEKDVMGSPSFNGIRVDAEEAHPIKNLMLRNIQYTTIGSVDQEELPMDYPKVLDMRKHQGEVTSENYYPTWSRTGFMDIRNVSGLVLDGLYFKALSLDTRPPYLIEGCKVYKKEITLTQ